MLKCKIQQCKIANIHQLKTMIMEITIKHMNETLKVLNQRAHALFVLLSITFIQFSLPPIESNYFLCKSLMFNACSMKLLVSIDCEGSEIWGLKS